MAARACALPVPISLGRQCISARCSEASGSSSSPCASVSATRSVSSSSCISAWRSVPLSSTTYSGVFVQPAISSTLAVGNSSHKGRLAAVVPVDHAHAAATRSIHNGPLQQSQAPNDKPSPSKWTFWVPWVCFTYDAPDNRLRFRTS